MSLKGEYMGMPVSIDDLDRDNQDFYRYCGQNELRVQTCKVCEMKRLPPTSACPFCSAEESYWTRVIGRGVVYSYGEVHHAIQGAFRSHVPYQLLLVELDEQKGKPGEFDGLRLQGNLAESDGSLACFETVQRVGIGSRVRVIFQKMGDEIAMPVWTIDEEHEQPKDIWRYPIE
jgi:uncharacterized OB-fold protein